MRPNSSCWSRTWLGVRVWESRVLILLDFSKAFDKVSYSKLIWKLDGYGIRTNVLHCINAFLGNRLQRVVVAGEESGSVQVTSGITKGPVLGPILFLVYINGLLDNITSHYGSLQITLPCTSPWRARMTVQCYSRLWKDCLCGRLTGTWNSAR